MPQLLPQKCLEGRSFWRKLLQCSKVLMTPRTSVLEHENPYLRPEHEIDLSFIAPPSKQGELLSGSSQCLRGAHVAAAFSLCALWHVA